MKHFLAGAGSVLLLMPNLKARASSSYRMKEQKDFQSIQDDWNAVSKDLSFAFTQLVEDGKK